MLKVSIIVPVYNAEKYIRQCVESLSCQTLQDIEIILVNDGSRDRSGDICDALKTDDERIQVIHQENQGVSVARNNGLANATGKWVTFVDADDWAEPTMCERAVTIARDTNADIVLFSYYTEYADRSNPSKLVPLHAGDVTSKKEFIQQKTISQCYGDSLQNNNVSAGTTWGKLVRLSLLQESNICFKQGLTRAQDTVFWLYGFEYAKRIVLIDELLYHYRISNTSICSGTRYLPKCEEPFRMLLTEYKHFIEEFHKGPEFQDALYLRTIQVLMWHLKHKYFHPENTQPRRDSLKAIHGLIREEPFHTAIKHVKIKKMPKSLIVMTCFLRIRLVLPYQWVFLATSQLSRKKSSRYS